MKASMMPVRATALMLITLLLTMLPASALYAQENGGQLCVRAYEDLNTNQARDPGEPFIQSGLIANLQDADGVVIATATIEDSPSRLQGLICFRDLAPGQYSVFVTSVIYAPTTADNLTVNLTVGSLPALLEFGGERLISTEQTPLVDEDAQLMSGLERVLAAAVGALVSMGIVGVLGVLVYVLFIRPKAKTNNGRPRNAKPHAKPHATPPTDPDAPFRPPTIHPPAQENIWQVDDEDVRY